MPESGRPRSGHLRRHDPLTRNGRPSSRAGRVRVMADQFVSVERRDDGVAVVRLDRPKMNALSVALLEQLAEVAEGLTADPPGAVVVWGGERIFAAGADISEFGGPDEAAAITAGFHDALDAIAALPRF